MEYREIVALIDAIINGLDEKEVNALYQVIICRDYDYIENLFRTKEDFEEFIEKWKPSKCCVKEEDND